MAFGLWEILNIGARPIALYEFAWGGTKYRYTSADRDIVWSVDPVTGQPLTWEAIAISDNGFTMGDGDEFEVSLPRNLAIVDVFRLTPPSTKIALTCFRFHKDDPDKESNVYWVGTVGSILHKSLAESALVGLPIGKTTKRAGNRLCWSTGCPHALYDVSCQADRELFKTVTTITAVSGIDVTVASLGTFAGAQYAGGFLEWQATPEGAIDRRGLESFKGGKTFSMLGSADRLTVGMAVTLFLGCDLSPETCDTVFDNLPNHGGFKFMSKDSPFDGNQVF